MKAVNAERSRRAYHGREEPRAQPAASRHSPTFERAGAGVQPLQRLVGRRRRSAILFEVVSGVRDDLAVAVPTVLFQPLHNRVVIYPSLSDPFLGRCE